MNQKKVILIILDGWGIAKDPNVSAIEMAHTPFVDNLYHVAAHSTLDASGLSVGLPDGQMGNSEVGHMNLGAGRVVYQDLVRINNDIKSGDFYINNVLLSALEKAKKSGRPLHIMGLLSDGGVHAHIEHTKALMTAAHQAGVHSCIHAFTDGRDTDPNGGMKYMKDLLNHAEQTSAKVVSLIGRYYAMDRDQRWERVARAYNLLVNAEGERAANPLDALAKSYALGITDEFVLPYWCGDDADVMKAGDVVINANFRTDRGRQITQALCIRSFEDYSLTPLDIDYYTMTRYDESFDAIEVLYDKDNLRNTLGDVLAENGKTQIRIAETEKYPHVTFFFSGGREEAFAGEQRILCPSPKVATYDMQPEMSAWDITNAILPELKKRSADFICLNFANPDMVGHTGVMEAAVKACETVDECTRNVVHAALENDYTCLILADHGNADCMRNDDGTVNTAHTTQPVPFFVLDNHVRPNLQNGKLGDIAPSILHWMGLSLPDEMTGNIIIGSNADAEPYSV